jgi:trimeric autotransporter adhesin
MRRAASAVLPLSGGSLGEGLPIAGAGRPGARLVALFGAVIVAAAVTVMTAAGPIARENASRIAAGTQLPAAAWGPVSRALGRDDPAYRTVQAGPGFVALNPHQRLRAQFSPAGVSVHSGAVLLGVRLGAYGYGNTLRALEPVAPIARANRVLYRHGSLSEWYANGPAGLEQGFTLTARPAGHRAGPLTLALGLSGNARTVPSRGSDGVTFSHGASSLSYRGLVVTDARGRTLAAWLQVRGRQLLLRVRDTGARYPLVIDPFIQQAKLTASDGAAHDSLGISVAIQGNTVVAGADLATVNGHPAQGAVYVFVKPRGGWANATETAKLTASDGVAGDELGGISLGGNGVGISGDTIVAGAYAATANGNPGEGAAYVFVKPKGGWQSETETAKLTASDGAPGDALGTSVAVSGDTIVAGAYQATVNGNSAQGAAYVFLKSKRGWHSETETAKLTASDGGPGDGLGNSVALSRDTVVAGAVCATVNGNICQGAAYVFIEPRGGWRSETEAAKLTASDSTPGTLGTSVAISGDTVVAGAPDQVFETHPGAVYVFVRPKGGWQSETQTATLTASDAGPADVFGASVAIQGDTIVAGAPFAAIGAVYVFVEPRRGWADETESAKLTASDPAFGVMEALSGDTLLVGAFTAVNGNPLQGAVYVFEGRDGGFQTAAINRAVARETRAPAAWPRWCARYAASRGALAPPGGVAASTYSSPVLIVKGRNL